jgi:hypothetical protein
MESLLKSLLLLSALLVLMQDRLNLIVVDHFRQRNSLEILALVNSYLLWLD